MDLWPASLAVGGLREDFFMYRIFEKISKAIYRGADRILISSESFRGYLTNKFQIADEKIQYHPQYADSTLTDGCSFEKDTIDLMFAGNIGAAQSVPTILNAAKLLEEHKELRWHIVGDGSELESCQRLAKKLKLENVLFHGRKDQQEMPKYFSMADAMLLTLIDDPVISLTLPRKAQAYMAAGKPIIGAANGEIALVIERSGCGFCANAEDARGLADAVITFLEFADKSQLGNNARDYYERHFSRKEFMDKLEATLSNCEPVFN